MASPTSRAAKRILPDEPAAMDPQFPIGNACGEHLPPAQTIAAPVERAAWDGSIQTVDDLNVEESIKTKAIGDRIRRLRLKRSMGLVELGRRTGMSASFLSQLETGRVVPTLRNLSRIALVFGKDLAYFLQDEKKNQFKKSRARDRVRLPIGDKAAPRLISESMSALIPDRSLVPCIAEFLPNTQNSSFEPTVFKGQEFAYVLRGSLTISTASEREELSEGDVVWVDGSLKRQYNCKDGKAAAVMIITFPTAR